jgi:hypothetical protein
LWIRHHLRNLCAGDLRLHDQFAYGPKKQNLL